MPNLNVGLEKRIAEGSKMVVALDFDGWQPGGLTSDFVKDGQYEVQIMKCEPQLKKSGEGLVVRCIFKIVAPNCEFKSKQLVSYHPVPQGESQSQDNQKKRFLHSLFYSILTGSKGKEAAEALKKAGVREIPLSFFEGKTAWVKVQESSYNSIPIGVIQFYIAKEDYESSPGPYGVTPSGADISKSAAAAIDTPAAKTEAKPPAAKNAVDDLLGA